MENPVLLNLRSVNFGTVLVHTLNKWTGARTLSCPSLVQLAQSGPDLLSSVLDLAPALLPAGILTVLSNSNDREATTDFY
jgi:hypothetical protein